MESSNILLVGFMGVGKGSLARALTSKTDYFAIDTDDLIESFENTKIRKIFQEHGENYFRNLEVRVANWLEKHVEKTVISTGGGFFAVENLNRIGKVVFLQADFDSIFQKMMDHPKAHKKIKKRPLFQDAAKARELFDLRQPLYQAKADIGVNVVGRPVEEVADEILSKLT